MTRILSFLSIIILFTSPCRAEAPDESAQAPQSTPAQASDGLLTLTAKILFPDGSPAAGAIVESLEQVEDPRNLVQANEEGVVQIRSVFGNSARIHASSPDGTLQTTLIVTAPNVRTTCSEPVLLQLEPAVPHDVTVFSNDQPVAGAEVVAEGICYRVSGVTDSAGKTRLHLPAGQTLRELAAWHPQHGVAGIRDYDENPPQETSQLSLLPPAPHTIRIVDTEGQPVAGIRLTSSVRTEESDWINLRDIEASYVETDENGEAVISWAPREKLKYLDVEFIGSSWKKDKTDRDKMAEGLTTIHVRQEMPVTGRLVMPEGASAEGILITGFGFGPYSNGDIPVARARQDGTFTMRVPSDHGYVLGVSDSEWASTPWTGLIFAENSSKPAEIEIEAYRGTPLTVLVTRGPNHEHVKNAWVYIKQRGELEFTDSSGEVHDAVGAIGGWARSDADGKVHAAVGDGTIEVRLSSGDWDEKQSIEVYSDERVEVVFHRAWSGDRQVVARMTLDGAPFTPSKTLVVHAFSEKSGGFYDTVHETEIGDDGAITVTFDAENLSLLVIDQEKQLSGFAKLGAEETTAELIMQPMATYDGWVFDEESNPMANRTMQLWKKSSRVDVVEPQQTDETGWFEFTGVPVEVPLRVVLKNENHLPKYYVRSSERLFEPGEQRSSDVLLVRLRDDSDRHEKAPADPLTERLTGLCRKARVSRMRTLVILQGGGPADVSNLASRLLDDEAVQPILSYLPLRLTPAEIDAEAEALVELDWPLPKEGEVVLVVVGDDEQAIDSARIDAEEPTAAIATGTKFLAQHALPTRNAPDLFADSKEEASSSGRRIWLIQGGPRCGPCFRLAQWIDEHHTELEKDYVILKLMSAVDEQVSEVMDQIGKEEGGIPWHAILEPDGTVITTSVSPLGNIGMPRSVESIRHFRSMIEDTAQHLTVEQINKLMASLSEQD